MAEPSQSNAELMSAALDEQLAPEEAAAFEEMLAKDPEAAEEFSQLRDMLALVKNLPEVEAPPDFYEKIARKVRRRRMFQGESFLLISVPFQVLSVLIVMAIAVTYMMLQLDRDPAAKLQRDPSATQGEAPPHGEATPEESPAE
ncbi:MAG: hypothetical protein R3A51_20845 [Nannocystaceae bacterium]